MKGLKLIPDETKINFVGFRFVAFAFSLMVIVGSFGLFATKGLNFGIDFAGGTLVEVKTPDKPGQMR